MGPRRDPASAPAVARHDERLPRHEEVRGRHNPVHRRLPGAVAVVEQVLHLRVVHVHDGELEAAVLLHRPEADHAGRRLLVRPSDALEELAAFRVQKVDEVRAVVDDKVRLEIEDMVQVLVVLVRRLPLLRVRLEAELLVQRGRDGVVRGERVAGREAHLRARLLESEGEDARLRLRVERHADLHSLEGLGRDEALADRREHGHVGPRPLHAEDAAVHELRHDAPMAPSAYLPFGEPAPSRDAPVIRTRSRCDSRPDRTRKCTARPGRSHPARGSSRPHARPPPQPRRCPRVSRAGTRSG